MNQHNPIVIPRKLSFNLKFVVKGPTCDNRGIPTSRFNSIQSMGMNQSGRLSQGHGTNRARYSRLLGVGPNIGRL
ncbi:hypothetical protein AQUCO_00600147v1 [Aquilegia coerulea]|uniref:Uncharacterized protein n=1 Tax=Aquilegia coerulea TaxID=218851 RepID=A0A2G5EN77_AQUCA|nr:hypothetical protein AQUCO_00600147v1 [Aquilegia coerulea]